MSRTQLVGFLFLSFTILLTVIGQLLIKRGVTVVSAVAGLEGNMLLFVWRTFTHPLVIVGLGCAVVSMACWTLALARLDLHVAYPFFGLAIVLILLCSRLMMGEPVSLLRWAGVAVICVGLWLVAQK